MVRGSFCIQWEVSCYGYCGETDVWGWKVYVYYLFGFNESCWMTDNDWMQAVGALLMSLSVTAAASWLCLTWAVFMWRVCNIRREIHLTRTDFHISQSPMRAVFGLFTKQNWTLKYFICPERCFLTDGSDFCYSCAFYLRKITVVETLFNKYHSKWGMTLHLSFFAVLLHDTHPADRPWFEVSLSGTNLWSERLLGGQRSLHHIYSNAFAV